VVPAARPRLLDPGDPPPPDHPSQLPARSRKPQGSRSRRLQAMLDTNWNTLQTRRPGPLAVPQTQESCQPGLRGIGRLGTKVARKITPTSLGVYSSHTWPSQWRPFCVAGSRRCASVHRSTPRAGNALNGGPRRRSAGSPQRG